MLVPGWTDPFLTARVRNSERGADKLAFKIDGVLQGEWSGNVAWIDVSFPVASGEHIFLWIYAKDTADSTGVDGGAVLFDSSGNRLYTLLGCTSLVPNAWNPVSASRMGAGGSDSITSTNSLPTEFYKLTVELP